MHSLPGSCRILLTCLLSAGIAVVTSGAGGCDTDDASFTPIDDPAPPARGYFTGVLPLPADGQELSDAYAQASTGADFVPLWDQSVGASGFWDFATALASPTGKTVVDEYIRGNGMFPLVLFSFMDRDPATGRLTLKLPPGMTSATLEDPAWRAAYEEAALDVVETVKPLYVSTGNEVNRWYEQYGAASGDPNGFQHFISLHQEIYDEVKARSPQTKVFFVLAREIVAELREARPEVLTYIDPSALDVLVMTSYPHAVRLDEEGEPLERPFNTPSDIPDEYYSGWAASLPGLPVGFSEIGWPSTEFYGGESGQADFIVEASGRLSAGVELEFFGWPWLHDIDENDDLGLRYRDDTPKEAWATWSAL